MVEHNSLFNLLLSFKACRMYDKRAFRKLAYVNMLGDEVEVPAQKCVKHAGVFCLDRDFRHGIGACWKIKSARGSRILRPHSPALP